MIFLTEKWHEMNIRHKREKVALMKEAMSYKLPMKETAELLGCTEQTIRNFLKANRLKWWSGIQTRSEYKKLKKIRLPPKPRPVGEPIKRTKK